MTRIEDVRRIRLTGRGTPCISFPREWLEALGAAPGSRVLVRLAQGRPCIEVCIPGAAPARERVELSHRELRGTPLECLPACLYILGVPGAEVSYPSEAEASRGLEELVSSGAGEMVLHTVTRRGSKVLIDVPPEVPFDEQGGMDIARNVFELLKAYLVSLGDYLQGRGSQRAIEGYRASMYRSMVVLARHSLSRIAEGRSGLHFTMSMILTCIGVIMARIDGLVPLAASRKEVAKGLERAVRDAIALTDHARRVVSTRSFHSLKRLIDAIRGVLDEASQSGDVEAVLRYLVASDYMNLARLMLCHLIAARLERGR